ncbi:hypothetical protein N7523_011151 [Penicillium sp. IBT 18751x]|nr:hypothetical protein N7523_011151 [Penicillium sp. IBT 18751x]
MAIKTPDAKVKTYSTFAVEDPYNYLRGLNNYHEAESIPGSLPLGQMHPQRTKNLLYPDRLSGAPFVLPRKESKQTTYYRTIPSTSICEWKEEKDHPASCDYNPANLDISPRPASWEPAPFEEECDFISGLRLLAAAGDPNLKKGLAYHVYTAGKSMKDDHAFTSSDGDFLIVPQAGTIDIITEMGPMRIRPNEIAVIPRGIRFHVAVIQGPIRGYVVEIFLGHFELPELGPLGSLGLANARDFEVPLLQDYKLRPDTKIFNKFGGRIFSTTFKGTIFNVIAWHGSYYPFKYDLGKFNTVGSLTYDHTDPSTLVVLTVPSEIPGTPLVDLAAIGPRWTVHEDTLRPAYAHRNTASEFYGWLTGGHKGEAPGTITLYNGMCPHGVGREGWDKAVSEELVPVRPDPSSMAIMFESSYNLGISTWGQKGKTDVGNRYNEFEHAPV